MLRHAYLGSLDVVEATEATAAPSATSPMVIASEPPTTKEGWQTEWLKMQQAMLVSQQEQTKWQQRFTEADTRARYFQIAAILAVPLATAFWRWFLGRRNADKMGIT